MTGEFLDLEREIDSFEDRYPLPDGTIRPGKHAGLREQLALIEMKATGLRQKAAEGI